MNVEIDRDVLGWLPSTHSYDREGSLTEFFPDGDDRAEVEAGAQALINVSRALMGIGLPQHPDDLTGTQSRDDDPPFVPQ